MRRGDLVLVAQKGLYEGKSRPAMVVQAEVLLDVHRSILVCQLSSDARSATGAFYRVTVTATPFTGLKEASVVLADRIVTVSRANIRDVIGRLDEETIGRVDAALGLMLGLP